VTDVHLKPEMKQQGKEYLPRIECDTSTSIINAGKGKDRVHPRTGHEGP
jgi:hypothetical protein